jgi:hypothetical protein
MHSLKAYIICSQFCLVCCSTWDGLAEFVLTLLLVRSCFPYWIVLYSVTPCERFLCL